MYEIRKDGGVIALTEKPNYIRRHADGFYILCEEEDAQGVAVDGTVYRLMGHTGLDELEEVQLIEKDTGTVLQSSSEAVGIAFVTMTERGDIDGVTAGEHAELFSPWAYPVAYTAGQIRERSGKLYKCLQAHTSQADWKPEDSPSLWGGHLRPGGGMAGVEPAGGQHRCLRQGRKGEPQRQTLDERCGRERVGAGRVWMDGGDGMTETVIVAVLSLIGTMAGAYFANKKSAALIAYRLEELEKKVAKHNGLVERTYHLEEAAAVFEEKLKVTNHRIDDLERET